MKEMSRIRTQAAVLAAAVLVLCPAIANSQGMATRGAAPAPRQALSGKPFPSTLR